MSGNDVPRPIGRATGALDHLATLGEQVVICCLYRSASYVAVPDELARLLPAARWVEPDQHPLSLIDDGGPPPGPPRLAPCL